MEQNLFVIPHPHLSPYPFMTGHVAACGWTICHYPSYGFHLGGFFDPEVFTLRFFCYLVREPFLCVPSLCSFGSFLLCLFHLAATRCHQTPPMNSLFVVYLPCLPVSSSPTTTTTYPSFSLVFKNPTHCVLEKNTLSLAELNSVCFSIAMLAQPTFKALRAEAKISSLHESQWSLFFLRPGHGDRESQLKTRLRSLDLICSDAFCVMLPCFGVWFYQLSAQKSTICPSLQISSPFMSICERGQNRSRR